MTILMKIWRQPLKTKAYIYCGSFSSISDNFTQWMFLLNILSQEMPLTCPLDDLQ